MSSNAAVGSQKQPAPIGSGGSTSYGPIGSTTFSQAAPGPPFPSGNVPAQPQSKMTSFTLEEKRRYELSLYLESNLLFLLFGHCSEQSTEIVFKLG